jgi:type II secretory pathway pseudopilin PulG
VHAPIDLSGVESSPLKPGPASAVRWTKKDSVSLHSFSLVEVVIAIAVISFSLLIVIAMLGQGLSNNHDSNRRLQAADLASLLVATRRASPTNSNLTNFALPALGSVNSAGQDVVSPVTNYVKVQTDGTVIPSGNGNANQVVYNLRYMVTPSGPLNNIANVNLVLWWPGTLAASATTMPTNNPSTYYEMMTQVVLP